ERGFSLGAVVALDLDVEHLALADARHTIHAEGLQRALDRLALRIEDAGLEGDGHASLHRGVLHRDMAPIARTASGSRTISPDSGPGACHGEFSAKRLSAQGRLLIAPGAARDRRRGSPPRRAGTPPRTATGRSTRPAGC